MSRSDGVMRLWVSRCAAGVLGLSLGLGAALLFLGHRSRVVPALLVDPQVYDWGVVVDPKLLRAEFTISNYGEQPVRFKRVRMGCRCGAVKFSRDAVPPGGSVKVVLEADPGGTHGDYSVSAEVHTDSPQIPVVVLTAVGTIVRSNISVPYQLGVVPARRPLKREVVVARRGPSSRLLSVDVAYPPDLQATILPPTDAYFRVAIAVDDVGEGPRWEGELELEATDNSWKHAKLMLRAVVEPVWDFPADLFLGAVKAGDTRRVPITLREVFRGGAGNVQPRDFGVVRQPDWIRARFSRSLMWGAELAVEVTPKAMEMAGQTVEGEIVVRTPIVFGRRDRLRITVHAIVPSRAGIREAPLP